MQYSDLFIMLRAIIFCVNTIKQITVIFKTVNIIRCIKQRKVFNLIKYDVI